ncbi:MAG: capsid cement protein [Chloroflexota bacterium]
MQNYEQPGSTLTLTAPYTRTSGQGAMVGSIFGVACSDVTSGDEGEFQVDGVFTLAKTSAQAWAVGDKLYWNASTKAVSNVAGDGSCIGVATAVAANPSSTGEIKLSGMASSLFTQQTALADVTDNSGGAAANGTIEAVTAPTALTDNGGGTADATVASQAAPVALTDSSGYDATHDDTVAAVAAIVTLTDSSGLDGSHNDTIAAMAALVDLTDSTGYSGTHGDTLAATAALVDLTDDTGKSGTHNDVAEAITTFTPSVAWNGSSVYPSADDATEIGAAITALAQNESDIVQKVKELVARDLVHAQNVSNIGQKVKEVVAREQVAAQNISDLAQKTIELVAREVIHAQNESDITQKIIELVTLATTAQNNLKEVTTRQGENRAAIVALTHSVTELATKLNAALAKLRSAGVIAT